MRLAGSPTLIPLFVGLLTLAGSAYALALASRDTDAAPPQQGAVRLSTDDCIEVDDGDTLEISIYVDNAPELFAFEVYFAYDPDLLEVVDRDVRIFLSEGPNSNVFDFSDAVPNSTGLYRLGAADVALDGTAETGDGTLAEITLRARDEGVSPAAIFRSNSIPLGPRLTTDGGGKIGDTNGDEIFDGIIASGQVAVGEPCAPVAPTVDPDIIPEVTPTRPAGASPGPPDDQDDPGTTGGTGATGGPADDPSDAPGDGTDGPADGTGDPPPDPTEDNGTDGDDPTQTRRASVSNGEAGGGSGGAGSGSDNTFWAIVLIGGGVGLGLVATGVFAVVTRKPA